MADDPLLETGISSIANPSLKTPLLGEAMSRIRRPPFERTWSVPDQYHSPTFSSKSSSKSSVDKGCGTRDPASGIGHQFQALFSGTSFIRNSIESVIGRRQSSLGKKSTQIAGHVIAAATGSSSTSMENAGFPHGISSSSVSGEASKVSTNGGGPPSGGQERANITQPSSPNTRHTKGFLPYFSRSQQFPSLKLQHVTKTCRAHAGRKPMVLSTPILQDRHGPQDRNGPRITITTHSNEEFLIEDHISPDAKQPAAQHGSLGNARSQLLGDDTSLYGTPKNEVSSPKDRSVSNSAGYYLRDQIISFFQPSDNKLAMKLFGNKNALMKEKMRQKAVGNWVIHPCSNFRFYWDLFMLVLLIANLIILPVAISFFNDDLSTHWIVFNGISDTVFLLDLVINFRTGIIADNFADDIILEPKEIAKHYLKTWFLLDLISSIPLDYIILMLSPDANVTQIIHAGRALRIFRLVKLLSLLRLLRLSRLVRYVNQWEEFLTVASKFMRIVNLVLLILLLGHWNGCLQWLVPMLQDFPRDSWIALEDLQHCEWTEQYTWALFKALSHMLCIGYGRFPPQSTTDVWLTTVSMLTGATCYALFVGHSTTLIQSFDTSRRLYREKFKQVEEYMIYRKLPRKLRQKITDYYEHRYQGKMFDEASILAEVNECLKEEIVNYNCRALVASVPFFTHADPNFVSDIVAKLRHEVYLPGDYIVREGSIGSKMYFIQEGIVDIVTSNGEVATSLSDGSYFGEISLLANAKRVASVRAETYCNLFSLSVDHFHSVLERYPVMRRTMESVAAERLNKIGKNPAMLSNREDLEADITMVNELIRSATPNPSSGSEESESEGEGKHKKKKKKKDEGDSGTAAGATAKEIRETLGFKIATVLKRSKSNVSVGDALKEEKTSKA